MKKFFAMILVLAMALSLCACGSYVDENGNHVEVENGEIVLELSDEFTVTKLDESTYYVSNHGTRHDYTAVLKGDEYAVVVDVSVEQYACWEIGDTISGAVVSKYDAGYQRPVAHITIGEETFNVSWYGKY